MLMSYLKRPSHTLAAYSRGTLPSALLHIRICNNPFVHFHLVIQIHSLLSQVLAISPQHITSAVEHAHCSYSSIATHAANTLLCLGILATETLKHRETNNILNY